MKSELEVAKLSLGLPQGNAEDGVDLDSVLLVFMTFWLDACERDAGFSRSWTA